MDGTTSPLLRVSDGATAVARVVAVDAAEELSLSTGREADTTILGAIDGNTLPLLRISDGANNKPSIELVLVRAAAANPSIAVDRDDAKVDIIILSAVDGTTPPLTILRVSDGPIAAMARVVAVDTAEELSLSTGSGSGMIFL